MTWKSRRSKREIERILEELEPTGAAQEFERPDLTAEEKEMMDQMFDPDQPGPEGIDVDRFLDELTDLGAVDA